MALLAVPQAHAQLDITVLMAGGTNNIAASTVRNYTNSIPVTRGSQFALMGVATAVSSGATSNAFLTIDRSVDGSNWELGVHRLPIAINGTTALPSSTNWSVGAYGFYRVRAIENTNTVALTNLTIKYSVKPGI